MKFREESKEAILTLVLVMIIGGLSAIIGTFLFMGVNKVLVTFGFEPMKEFHTVPGGAKIEIPTPAGYKPKNLNK